jgi:hypothetical protein
MKVIAALVGVPALIAAAGGNKLYKTKSKIKSGLQNIQKLLNSWILWKKLLCNGIR